MAELQVDAHFEWGPDPREVASVAMDVYRMPCVSIKLLIMDTVIISWGTDRVGPWNKWQHLHGSDRRGPDALGRMVPGRDPDPRWRVRPRRAVQLRLAHVSAPI